MCSLSNSIKNYKHILFAKDKINIQLHYVTVKQLASQQMCECSETDGIALCLRAVQKCGSKVIQVNGSNVSDDSAILSDKNCN
jgi:hypothetical protein